jgi:hypothetical protein
MAVGPQNYIARLYQPGFQHDMLSDAVINIKQMTNSLPLGEFPNNFLIVGNFFGMSGCLQVKGIGDFIGVPNPCIFAISCSNCKTQLAPPKSPAEASSTLHQPRSPTSTGWPEARSMILTIAVLPMLWSPFQNSSA